MHDSGNAEGPVELNNPPEEGSPADSETLSVSSEQGLRQLRLRTTPSGVVLCHPTMKEVCAAHINSSPAILLQEQCLSLCAFSQGPLASISNPVPVEEIREQARIFKKDKLTVYQQEINKAAGLQPCLHKEVNY